MAVLVLSRANGVVQGGINYHLMASHKEPPNAWHSHSHSGASTTTAQAAVTSLGRLIGASKGRGCRPQVRASLTTMANPRTTVDST